MTSLVNEYNKAGFHSIQFNGHNLSSGIYFYKFDRLKILFKQKS